MSLDIQHPKIDAEDFITATTRAAKQYAPGNVNSQMAFIAGAMTDAYRSAIADSNRLRDRYIEAVGDTRELGAVAIRIAKQTVMRGGGPYSIPIECNAALDSMLAYGDGTSDFDADEVPTTSQRINAARPHVSRRTRFSDELLAELRSGSLNDRTAG